MNTAADVALESIADIGAQVNAEAGISADENASASTEADANAGVGVGAEVGASTEDEGGLLGINLNGLLSGPNLGLGFGD